MATEPQMVQELDEAVRSFSRAWAAGDTDVLQKLLSPSYTHIDVRGRLLNRDEWLRYASGRAGDTTDIVFADVTTRVIGDVAIVTARNDVSGGNIVVGDSRTALSMRFTTIWVRRDGRWLREAAQVTLIDPSTPPLGQNI
jgi:ketosteroid isomerase-like protein